MIDETLALIIKANALRLADRLDRQVASHSNDKMSMQAYIMPSDARIIAIALRMQYGT